MAASARRKAVGVFADSYGGSMIAMVSVDIGSSASMPERFRARRKQIDDLVDRARPDALLHRPDGALAQREVVCQDPHPALQDLIEPRVAGAFPGRHHPVLHQEQGHLAAGLPELAGQRVEMADVAGFPRAFRLDQHVLAHVILPLGPPARPPFLLERSFPYQVTWKLTGRLVQSRPPGHR